MYNKTIIRFSFRVILNNRGLGKCYQPRPSAGLIMLTSTFIIPYIIRKTSLNNLLFSMEQGMVHWWEPSPSHQCGPVSNVGINASVGWVCCWFSPLLQEINFSPVTCTPVFLSPKSIIFKFQFDQERQTKNHSVDENPKCAKTAEKVVNSAVRVKEKTFWLTYSCICYRSNLISG